MKTQIRALQAESEEVKLNQEELNANMVSLSAQVGSGHEMSRLRVRFQIRDEFTQPSIQSLY